MTTIRNRHAYKVNYYCESGRLGIRSFSKTGSLEIVPKPAIPGNTVHCERCMIIRIFRKYGFPHSRGEQNDIGDQHCVLMITNQRIIGAERSQNVVRSD